MEKLDLRKKFKAYYSATRDARLLDVPPVTSLAISGQGEPAGEEFNNRLGVLYALAYGVRKLYKLQDQDFKIPPMSGLWWVNGGRSVLDTPTENWKWKLFIHLPDYVKEESVKKAKTDILKKKKVELVKEIELEKFEEGKSIQILHLGPYTAEQPTVDKILELMKAENLKQNGHHHEIYLSDPRKVSPEKLKTIIRYPVASD
jgi:hypothetical protein